MEVLTKRVLPAMLGLCALLFVCQAAVYDWPSISTGPESSKVFRVKKHFRYVQRMYQPQVTFAFDVAEPRSSASAEESLRSHLSAMKAGDFDWWLHTWDQKSQAKINSRASVPNRSKEALIREWKSALRGKTEVALIRWILTGEYVLVTYKLLGKEQAIDSPEIAVAFHLSNGLWKVSMDLEDDPVFLHFADDKRVFERTVRG